MSQKRAFETRSARLGAVRAAWWTLAAAALLAGCEQEPFTNQPRYEVYEESAFFADGMASRPMPAHTVPRGRLETDVAFYHGTEEDGFVSEFPREKVAEALGISGSANEQMVKILERGQERYGIFCAVCHDLAGTGHGMIVQRGFPQPPSYHTTPRLLRAPVGYFFVVITNGKGRMPEKAEQVPPADRWAIAAYVRTLQLSQRAPLELLPQERQADGGEGGAP